MYTLVFKLCTLHLLTLKLTSLFIHTYDSKHSPGVTLKVSCEMGWSAHKVIYSLSMIYPNYLLIGCFNRMSQESTLLNT